MSTEVTESEIETFNKKNDDEKGSNYFIIIFKILR